MDSILERVADFAELHRMEVTGGDVDTLVIEVGGRSFLCLDKPKLFNSDMKLLVTDYDKAEAEGSGADYVFEFGGNYYWSSRNAKEVEFNDFRYIGKCKQELDNEFVHLGIHGGYEIMNGSGAYKSWCKKANFYGHKALGICEHQTLAGAVAFQTECKDAKIKPVIGMTINVSFESGGTFEKQSKCKVYAINNNGWRNILRIHKAINIDNNGDSVSFKELLKLLDGVALVLGWGFTVNDSIIKSLTNKGAIANTYYQIDSIMYVDDSHDKSSLLSVKNYLENYISDISPVLINDTYYIDPDHSHIKGKLNSSSGKFSHKLHNAHYKNLDDTFKYLAPLFDDDDDRLYMLFEQAVENVTSLVNSISFTIETGVVKMPKFECGDLVGRYEGFADNEELFWKLIEDGMEKLTSTKDIKDTDVYFDRINLEVDVIKNGGFIDYFLVVWDIIRWSSDNSIYTGIGRGSAGGCLVAYLLDITRIDPIEYNLPFERFMNAGRLAGSLPDIDSDFEGLRRDDVKRYMESKYGLDYVCSIGSYSKLRIKAAMNEMWSDKSKLGTIKYMTAMIKDRDGDWDELFRSSNKKNALKEFVLDNVTFVNNVRLVLDQPKNTSIHAAGVVIVPKQDREGNPMTIFDWMPLTKRDGVLISEWEGTYLEKCGFMKNDILGTRQLDKFRYITNLIKETTGEDVDIYNVPVDDDYVFDLFTEGSTEDTFHFGSPGLKSYCKQVKPQIIDDLIDTISLHRPALMDIGAHKDFVNIRHGRTKAHYDFMLEGITKSTNGIIVYQEQVMEAARDIGGFTMQEADDVRRAMGKKKIEVIKPYKDQFVKGAVDRGCPPLEADQLWNKLELFSGYGFNRSHATAYAMTGYVGMWFKAHYPLQFWTAAFKYAKDEDIPKFLSEMHRTGKVKVSPPDINTSGDEFTTDYSANTIHWSLSKIKQVGDVATDDVMADRDKSGKYFSIEEFFKRVTRKKVNKKVITSMIFAGCMDKMCGITNITDRIKIFREYAKLIDETTSTMLDLDKVKFKYWWAAKQKVVSGLGSFDLAEIAKESGFSSKLKLIDAPDVQDSDSLGYKCSIAGMIIDLNTHKGGKGEFANILIDSNDEQVWVTCWADTWEGIKKDVLGDPEKPEVKLIVISGKIEADSFKGVNVIATTNTSKATVISTGIPGKKLLKS